MAFPTSQVCGRTLMEGLGGTAIDLSATGDDIKVALFETSFTGTPDADAELVYGTSPWDAANGECSASGDYAQGGKNLASKTLTPGTDKWVFDAASVEWGSGTVITASPEGCLIYDDTTATDRVLAWIDFGAVQTVVAGTMTINWDATNGIFYVGYATA